MSAPRDAEALIQSMFESTLSCCADVAADEACKRCWLARVVMRHLLDRGDRAEAYDHDGAREDVQDARAAMRLARIERDEARANFLRCAQAIGIVHETDGRAPEAGPIQEVEAAIRGANACATRAEAIAAAWREYHEADRAIGAASAPIDRHHSTHRDLAWRDRARLWAEEHVAEQETYDLAVARLKNARTALEALGEKL